MNLVLAVTSVTILVLWTQANALLTQTGPWPGDLVLQLVD